jgi:hypothetical protein
MPLKIQVRLTIALAIVAMERPTYRSSGESFKSP